METPKLGSLSVLIIMQKRIKNLGIIIGTDEDPSLRIESFAIINLRGVSTKLCFDRYDFYLIFGFPVFIEKGEDLLRRY